MRGRRLIAQEGETHESQAALRARLAELVDFSIPTSAPTLEVVESRQRDGYTERLVRYTSTGEENIPALLLLPEGDGPTAYRLLTGELLRHHPCRRRSAYAALGAGDTLRHVRFSGGHALTNERFHFIQDWVLAQALR